MSFSHGIHKFKTPSPEKSVHSKQSRISHDEWLNVDLLSCKSMVGEVFIVFVLVVPIETDTVDSYIGTISGLETTYR